MFCLYEEMNILREGEKHDISQPAKSKCSEPVKQLILKGIPDYSKGKTTPAASNPREPRQTVRRSARLGQLAKWIKRRVRNGFSMLWVESVRRSKWGFEWTRSCFVPLSRVTVVSSSLSVILCYSLLCSLALHVLFFCILCNFTFRYLFYNFSHDFCCFCLFPFITSYCLAFAITCVYCDTFCQPHNLFPFSSNEGAYSKEYVTLAIFAKSLGADHAC